MNILKLSLIFSLTSIFTLLLLSNLLSPNFLSIKDINNNYLNKNIKIQGKIISEKTYSNNFKILMIKDKTGTLQATLNSKNKINHNNQTLIITGKITEYNNELQIQVNKITFFSSFS